MITPRRLVRAVMHRTAWPTTQWVLRRATSPEGVVDPHVEVLTSPDDRLARLMSEAREPDGLIEPRFAAGDVAYVWLEDDQPKAFGWATRGPREVGGLALREAEGRAFLYNFFTAEAARGRGIYPRLLQAIARHRALVGDRECIIDVDADNAASRRGIEKAGFLPLFSFRFWTLFRARTVARHPAKSPEVALYVA